MELSVIISKDRMEIKMGKTVLASLDMVVLCGDKDETVDEAMLRSARALQNQLAHTVRESDIDDVVDIALPYISDCVRPKKRTTSGYRRMVSPYMKK